MGLREGFRARIIRPKPAGMLVGSEGFLEGGEHLRALINVKQRTFPFLLDS
jgi:hypothetical protein